MSYKSKSEQLIENIRKNRSRLLYGYNEIKSLHINEIDDDPHSLIVTQALTNLYQLSSELVTDELFEILMPLRKLTRVSRNISSHNYDKLNWSILVKVTEDILGLVTDEFLAKCEILAQEAKSKENDYTINIFD